MCRCQPTRDGNRIGQRAGKTDASLDQPTPCSQSQIEQDLHLRRQETAQVRAALVLSVGLRSGPVETAVNGTLVARLTLKQSDGPDQPDRWKSSAFGVGAIGLQQATAQPLR
jgi:hypothetical protein